MGIKEEAIGEAFNLGSAREHRVIDMANMVNKLAGNDAGIVFAERRNWDVKCRLLSSVEKAKKGLGYQPEMQFENGLKVVHQWFDENWTNIKSFAEF
jgi:UDP-glucose 4-epimerase